MLGSNQSKSIELLCPECGASKTIFGEPGARCKEHGSYYVAAKAVGHPDSDDLLGRVVGEQYLVFDRVGHGGMGSVFKAVHLKLKRHVAVKMIRPSVANEDDSEQLAQRFAFEAQSLSRLSHRNIVTVFDYGETSGLLYLVLEYVEGQTIASMIRERRTIPLEDTVELVCQLLDALKEMHAQGIVHRDIKPSNLMVETKGSTRRLVLIDFGVAKGKNEITGDFRRDLTRTGMAVGTPLYMSPEVLQDGELGPWSDLYAVGVLIFHMLSGRAPFSGASAEIITAHLRDPVPKLPDSLGLEVVDQVIAKAMAKRPGERYSSTDEFRAALNTALESALVSSPRVHTQVLNAPFSSASRETTKVLDGGSPSGEVAKSDFAGSSASEKIDNAEVTQSVDAFSQRQATPKFSLAVTEPHRFDFNVKPELEGNSRSRGLLSAMPLGLVIVSVVLVFFLLDYEQWFTVDTGGTVVSQVPSRQDVLPSSNVAVVATEADAGSKALTEKPVNDPSKIAVSSTESAKPPSRAKPSAGKKAKRPDRSARQRRSRKVTRGKEKTVKKSATTKQRSRQPVLKRPVEDELQKPDDGAGPKAVPNAGQINETPTSLLRRFDRELDNCQCDKSELTIDLLADRISSEKLRRLKERRNEECGVLGQGCQR